MTMRVTRARAYRSTHRLWRRGVIPSTVPGLISWLSDEDLAADCRGRLWYLLDIEVITLAEANFILANVAQPGWECTWFPISWLNDPRPPLDDEDEIDIPDWAPVIRPIGFPYQRG